MSAQLELSVVFPCLDEAETIAECIQQAKKVMEDASIEGEVVVADNGSTDGSQEIATKEGGRVVDVEDKGYGNALFGGFSAAKGKYIIHMDSDLSYPISEIPRYVEELRKGADLVMGSRLTPQMEPGAMPFTHRYLGTPVLTGLANLFFSCGIKDINCGMRGLTKEAFHRMDLRTGGMEFASEMVIKAALMKMKIAQFPIPFKKDKRGRPPHLKSFRDGWRHLRFQLLFSPTWLFFLPGLLLLLAGVATIGAIIYGLEPRIGLTTALLAQSAVSAGVLAMLFGVAAQGFAHVKQLHHGALSRLYNWIELEKGIVLGLIFMLAGAGVLGWSFYQISNFMDQPGYQVGQFNPGATKMAVVGATLFITGIQILFASFFLSLFKIETVMARKPAAESSPKEQ